MATATPNQRPEDIALDTIDRQLAAAGRIVQNKWNIDFGAGVGIAVREYQRDVGPADYALFVNRTVVGIIEAKPDSWGQKITIVEDQSYSYATLKWVNNERPLPFVYESMGVITRFTDYRDPHPRSRELFSFHRPETLTEWIGQPDTFRQRLLDIPPFDRDIRSCQVIAIERLERSLCEDRPRALVQSATDSERPTLLSPSQACWGHRILFLVDTKNLSQQAEQEFLAFIPNGDM